MVVFDSWVDLVKRNESIRLHSNGGGGSSPRLRYLLEIIKTSAIPVACYLLLRKIFLSLGCI